MASVVVENVSKRYHGAAKPAVDDVSLAIDDGEFFVLLGPSGCGKSTLLKLLAGLEDPTHGTIFFNQRCVNFVEPGDRNVAMVFQNYALYPHMSVRRNIEFPLKMRRSRTGTNEDAVLRVAAALGLEDLLDRPVSQLSGVQKQRVAVGRAIVRRPEVMLMDEPLSNLDALLRVQTREELLRLHRTVPGTVVYVTHDQVEAMTMASRIAIMDQGELVQVGTPREVYGSPATTFVAGFLGSPPMNLVPGRLILDQHGEVFVGGDLEVAVRLGEPARRRSRADDILDVTLGIRPEHIDLSVGAGGPEAESPWRVELVEVLGSEQIVSVVAGGERVRARMDGGVLLEEGQRVWLELVLSAVYLFDDTGAAIPLASNDRSARC